MRKTIIIAVALVCIGLLFLYIQQQRSFPISPTSLARPSMQLTSRAFQHNQAIPSKYTCDGQDVNPPLSLRDVPYGAKSLVLIVDDPDAPGDTWVHWIVWDIKLKIKGLQEGSFQFGEGEGALPPGFVEGTTSFGSTGYGGPCPPSGTHRYFFKLYALDVGELDLPVQWPANALSPGSSSATKSDLENAMKGHILAQAELIGLYQRQ